MAENSKSESKVGPSCGNRSVPSDPDELKERILSQDGEILAAVQSIAKAVSKMPVDPQISGTVPQALLVGGFVRDSAFGLKPKDADVQVYGVKPADLELLLESLYPERVKKVGKSYEVLKVRISDEHDIDVSISRTGPAVGHEDFSCGDPTVTPAEAAAMRDFSMNNLAADPCTGEVFDFCAGLEDLRAGHLRVSDSEVFQAQGINIYRAAQFAARLRLKPDADSFYLMSQMVEAGLTDDIHSARLTEEFNKLLVKGCQPSRGLELLRRLGIIKRHFPELNELVEGKPTQGEKRSAWVKTLMLVDQSAKILFYREDKQDPQESFVAMLSAVCSQMVKFTKNELPDFSLARSFLDRFFMSPVTKAAVLATILNYTKIDEFYYQFHTNAKNETREPERSTRKGGIRMPLRAPPVDNQQVKIEAARKIVSKVFPAKYSSALCLSEAMFRKDEPSDPYKAGEFFVEVVKSAGLHKQRKKTLLHKNEIIKTFNLPPGMHIGYIIGEIEKLRYDLVSSEHALVYLGENLDRLMAKAKKNTTDIQAQAK